MINIVQELSQISPKVENVTFIAVDGHGGSGKSTFAKLLSNVLGAEIIHTDDFAGWDNPLNWWPKVVNEVFEPIKDGAKTLSYQPVSWWENHHPEKVENQPVTEFMILEGVSSSREEFDGYVSYRIFIDTPKNICLERGVARDSSTGKSRDELYRMWEAWFLEEEDYMKRENPRQKAHLVLDGTIPFKQQIIFPEKT